MAGNTKLVGFMSGGRVKLERWGKQAVVQLTPETVDTLATACAKELPRRPPDIVSPDEFTARYDQGVGRVEVSMNVDSAKWMLMILQVSRVADTWGKTLQDAIKEHEDYHSASDEPGVTE